MKRKIMAKLLEWKMSHQRKPLILQGARQVGKTYILKQFAENEYIDYVYLNFEEQPNLANIFAQDLQPDRIIKDISLLFGHKINPESSLILFDEVQECPNALNSLKYFTENANEYHIVAAGSLLGVKLYSTQGFPVGKVHFESLYPLTFFEFLDALGKGSLSQYLQALDKPEPISIHDDVVTLLKHYLMVGGMPEAVSHYCQSQDFSEVRTIQKNILSAYILDIAKHAPKNESMKISTIWELIPQQLAKENKKFIFSIIKKSARAREYENTLQWLVKAGLVYKIQNISQPKLPLQHYSKNDGFKLYTLDVGLLAAMSDLSPKAFIDKNTLFSEFKGALTENYVVQELKASHPSDIYYWTSSRTAEIDIILAYEDNIYPLEVKSNVSKRKKSLLVYGGKYKPPILSRASLLNLKLDGSVCNYPLYLVALFPKLCLHMP